jgi:hypothetical protein
MQVLPVQFEDAAQAQLDARMREVLCKSSPDTAIQIPLIQADCPQAQDCSNVGDVLSAVHKIRDNLETQLPLLPDEDVREEQGRPEPGDRSTEVMASTTALSE